MTHEEIRQRICAAYPDASVEVQGNDCSLSLHIVSAAFAGMSRLQRQRSVMKLFAEELQQGSMHALTVRAQAPGE